MKIWFLVLLLTIGCNQPKGKIIEKNVIPEHNEVRFMIIHGPNNTTNRIPYLTKVPTEYNIVLQKDQKVFLDSEEWVKYNENYPHLEK